MVIDGKHIAQNILDRLKFEVSSSSFRPVFCDVLVGTDPASLSYVRMKGKRAEDIGLEFKLVELPESVSSEVLIEEIQKLNATAHIAGLIVQLPLPAHVDRQRVLDSIDINIDVDCLTTENTKAFYAGHPRFVPPTAAAVMEMLDSINISLTGKKVLVVGQGQLVGKPVTHLLRAQHADVIVADVTTSNLTELCVASDIIVSGVGKPKLITKNMVKPGAIIIDAGTSEDGGSIVGDVDFESLSNIASYITPVPGGVGPVTVAKLLENVVTVAENINS